MCLTSRDITISVCREEREREIYRLKDEEMKERKERSGCSSAESSDTKVELTRCKCGKEMVSSLGKNTARLYIYGVEIISIHGVYHRKLCSK